MTDLFVKLGPKAADGQFWDPVTETLVQKGETVKITQMSWLIKGALEGGHLVEVSEKESSKEKPFFKMNKEELVKAITPKLGEGEIKRFGDLPKAKMVNVAINIAKFETILEGLKDEKELELDERAGELDSEDSKQYVKAKDKVSFLKEVLPEYFDPFID